jgi:hypothetical protein
VPNYVYNRLVVRSVTRGTEPRNRLRLDEFKRRAARRDPEYHGEASALALDAAQDLDLSFWNFVSPRTEAETLERRRNERGWNIKNWGTKWDASEVFGTEGADADGYMLTYEFTTAYEPPLPVFEAMLRVSPDLRLTLSYEEEQGWGGRVTGTGGVGAIWHRERAYQIPTTHAELSDPDRLNKECRCAQDDARFSDCPS